MPVPSCRPSAGGEAQNLHAELAEMRVALERETAARKRLERALLETEETERKRLAQRLHDTLAQSLSGVHLLTRVLVRRLRGACPGAADEAAELGGMIQQAAGDLHDLERWLRSPRDETPKLVPALAEMARCTSGAISCELHCPEPVSIADDFIELQLVQIAQEAVGHALRRPGVKRIAISLAAPDEQNVTLEVRDDGEPDSPEPAPEKPSILDRLRHRASVIGASVTTTFQPNTGHTLTCQLPLPA